jgi:hypothetical protein
VKRDILASKVERGVISHLRPGLRKDTLGRDVFMDRVGGWKRSTAMTVDQSGILNRLLPTEAEKIVKTGLRTANRMANRMA